MPTCRHERVALVSCPPHPSLLLTSLAVACIENTESTTLLILLFIFWDIFVHLSTLICCLLSILFNLVGMRTDDTFILSFKTFFYICWTFLLLTCTLLCGSLSIWYEWVKSVVWVRTDYTFTLLFKTFSQKLLNIFVAHFHSPGRQSFHLVLMSRKRVQMTHSHFCSKLFLDIFFNIFCCSRTCTLLGGSLSMWVVSKVPLWEIPPASLPWFTAERIWVVKI